MRSSFHSPKSKPNSSDTRDCAKKLQVWQTHPIASVDFGYSGGGTRMTLQRGTLPPDAYTAVLSIMRNLLSLESVRDEELERAMRLLRRGVDPVRVLDDLSRRLTNKLIHAPTKALCEAGRSATRRECGDPITTEAE